MKLSSSGECQKLAEFTESSAFPPRMAQRAFLLQANCFFRAGDFVRAREEYLKVPMPPNANRDDPKNADALYMERFSEFFLSVIDRLLEADAAENLVEKYELLLATRASKNTKEDLFPPPPRSSVEDWLA